MNSYHIPVMLKEVTRYLHILPNHWYIDCTLGGGGHTQDILQAGGKVLGLDVDPESLQEVGEHLQIGSSLIVHQSNFSQLKGVVEKYHIVKVAGILFDLGVSSFQLDQQERGFSFSKDAPLDMRMDPTLKVQALDLINALHEGELTDLFEKYGEESWAKPIAKKIVETRKVESIKTTQQLAKIISLVKHKRPGENIHPATQVFQALRIAVNDELTNLQQALPQSLEVLQPGGRLVIISFHSLEDRIVKNFFKDEEQKGSITILTQKPIVPMEQEITQNPRSRSAKLRVAEKL